MRYSKEHGGASIFAVSPLGIFLWTIQLDQTVALFLAFRGSWRRGTENVKGRR